MPLGVLRAVQDADDFQRVAQIPEEDDMRSAQALQIARPNVNFSAAPLARCQRVAGIAQLLHIAPGLREAPFALRMVPELLQIAVAATVKANAFMRRDRPSCGQ